MSTHLVRGKIARRYSGEELTPDDGRQENGVAVKHRVHSELANGKHPHLPVCKRLDGILLVELFVVASLAV
jgi:hypothetical protein